MSITSKPKTSVKVQDYNSDQAVQKENIPQMNKSDSNSKNIPLEKKKEDISATPSTASSESVSEFVALKNVEGKFVRHGTQVSGEEPTKQKVHFRLDQNVEEVQKTRYPPVPLDKRPAKPALKRKRQFSQEAEEAPKPAKKGIDVIELKTSKAVAQGKEIWQKQVIEGYERVEEQKKILSLPTSTEFLNTWKHIKESEEACEKYLLGQAKPEKFGEIFKGGIDFDYCMELIRFGQRIVNR